jgi:hypothetical protein
LVLTNVIDEDADKGKKAPPVNLEPMSRQFLRTFDGKPRDTSRPVAEVS